MRKTLRRSCDACARSKLRCDLLTPRCSRCIKTNKACVYANEPLSSSLRNPASITSSSASTEQRAVAISTFSGLAALTHGPGLQSFDPFYTYPSTRLPKTYIQQLIHHFLSSIAFQYYPLDLDANSNPFVVSWFPKALADPALFHVSLQTASLDMELRAQTGFRNSDILMADSVALVRSKVEDSSAAISDETLSSVVTLAAIELGKGNVAVTELHIEGLLSMVRLRGGMRQVKLESPLTARMVSWVSMIARMAPQFATQDDSGEGEGIPPITQWIKLANLPYDTEVPALRGLPLEPAVDDVLRRLRMLFHELSCFRLSTTEFHDLVCFVLHRLLDQKEPEMSSIRADPLSTSRGLGYALALYLLAVHGPTYFSHDGLQFWIVVQLQEYLAHTLESLTVTNPSLVIWLLSVGMVSASRTSICLALTDQARSSALALGVYDWDDVCHHLRAILWLENPISEQVFLQAWQRVWSMPLS